MTRIAVLGLGAMGTALARAQLDHGAPVTVWNRTPGRAPSLEAKRADTLDDAIRDAELVVVCLVNDAATREVLGAVATHLRGKTVVNLTNGTPEQARRMARWASEHDVRYVDGGIMATPEMIGAPHALVLYSGDAPAFERHRDVLARFGAARFVGDDPGRAALLDLALLTGMNGLFAGALQAIAMAGHGGVSAGEFATLLVPWLQAMNGHVPAIATAIDTREFADGSNLAMQLLALDNLVEASRESGTDTTLLTTMQRWMRACVDAGHGADGLGRLIDVIRPAR
ncbi:Hypothetical protein I5071_43880 [Sandaracinus amylolyticus]|nr:Hypothetical protein I5071_43880 [Sandaracinus amylolyticus]